MQQSGNNNLVIQTAVDPVRGIIGLLRLVFYLGFAMSLVGMALGIPEAYVCGAVFFGICMLITKLLR